LHAARCRNKASVAAAARVGYEEDVTYLLVFAQHAQPSLDVPAWDAHAQRFFATRVTLARVEGQAELVVAVAPATGMAKERRVTARVRTAQDLAMADAAEAKQGGGLGGLAHRCPTVWTVACEGDDDTAALLLAAILASVGLGPVVDPAGPEIFGVKTARAKLERASAD
jgi:hypothetical protein